MQRKSQLNSAYVYRSVCFNSFKRHVLVCAAAALAG